MAPGLFSTTTGCPQAAGSFSARWRPVTSMQSPRGLERAIASSVSEALRAVLAEDEARERYAEMDEIGPWGGQSAPAIRPHGTAKCSAPEIAAEREEEGRQGPSRLGKCRWVRKAAMTAGFLMAAMIFRLPPACGQCSISMSIARLRKRAQLRCVGTDGPGVST